MRKPADLETEVTSREENKQPTELLKNVDGGCYAEGKGGVDGEHAGQALGQLRAFLGMDQGHPLLHHSTAVCKG